MLNCMRVFRVASCDVRRNVFCLTQKYHPHVLRINTQVHSLRLLNTEHTDVTVYSGPLQRQIRGVKFFSIVTSVAGLAGQPYLIKHAAALGNLPLAIGMLGFIGCFTYVTPFLLHWVTKKYVTEIRYTPEKEMYTAVTYNFFLQEKEVQFRPEDVEVPDVPGMFTSFHVKGIPLFVDPRVFEDKSHYIRIMGYDKPLDLKLGNLEKDEKKT